MRTQQLKCIPSIGCTLVVPMSALAPSIMFFEPNPVRYAENFPPALYKI